jgi:hypothetical protein
MSIRHRTQLKPRRALVRVTAAANERFDVNLSVVKNIPGITFVFLPSSYEYYIEEYFDYNLICKLLRFLENHVKDNIWKMSECVNVF